MSNFTNEYIKVDEINLHVITAGPQEGQAVLLLHGFPEKAKAWEDQILYLASKGFFVIAPDQRGYGDSDKPSNSDSYRLDTLAQDMIKLLDHYKKETASLVAHDWGAAVGWYLLSFHEDRFQNALLANCPHWEVFKKFLFSNPRQQKKSWYIFFVQLPVLSEYLLASQNFRYFVAFLKKSFLKNFYADELLTELINDWKIKKAFTPMLNWYRAMKLLKLQAPSHKIRLPLYLVWGEQEPFLLKEMATESLNYCEQATLKILPNVGHWPHHEDPEQFNKLCVHLLGTDKKAV